MRLLLGENFPADFVSYPSGHEVLTVHGLGWSGIKNGDLLGRASSICDVFVTLDRSLEYQQNVRGLSFSIVVVQAFSNRISDLVPLASNILAVVAKAIPGTVERVGA